MTAQEFVTSRDFFTDQHDHRFLISLEHLSKCYSRRDRDAKFTVGENIVSRMLCASFGIPTPKPTNRPLCDIPSPQWSHEIKCQSDPSTDQKFGDTMMFVLTRTASALDVHNKSPEAAMHEIVESLNGLIRARQAETDNGVCIHYCIYDKEQMVHFAKKLPLLEADRLTATWVTSKKGFKSLWVRCSETGNKIFNYTCNGGKIEYFVKIPSRSECTIFPFIETEEVIYRPVRDAKLLLATAANNAFAI